MTNLREQLAALVAKWNGPDAPEQPRDRQKCADELAALIPGEAGE